MKPSNHVVKFQSDEKPLKKLTPIAGVLNKAVEIKIDQEMSPIVSAIVNLNIRHSMDQLFTNQANTIGTHPESFQQNSN